MAQAQGAPLPVHVLTGFLGSGKTTLLNALLVRADFADAAVLINEFGAAAVDHLLVREAREELVVLPSGCVCCTLRGDLVAQLSGLLEQRARGEVPPFTRVVLETTGLADPAPIVQTLVKHPQLAEALYLDAIVCTVDAQFGAGTLARHAEARKQVAIADRLLITKTDLADASCVRELAQLLARLNPAAPIRACANGAVDADFLRLVGHLDTRSILREGELSPTAQGDLHGHSQVEALSVTFETPLAFDSFALWVSMVTQLLGEQLLRLKAVISARDEPAPLAIQAVQHVVYPPLALPAVKELAGKSRVVLLTCGM
jgi:G3E family GTPase